MRFKILAFWLLVCCLATQVWAGGTAGPGPNGVVCSGPHSSLKSCSGVTDDAQVKRSEMGAASGVATLDTNGKLPASQLTSAVVGAVVYQGVWNATTNSPTLASGTGTKGYYYVVSVAGTTAIDGIDVWNVGDTIIFNGTLWNKIDGIPGEVVSVAGRTGAVILLASDVGALPIAGGTLTGKLTTPASASGRSGLTLPHGVAPSSPVDGDLWSTSSGLFARINGTTVGPFAVASGPTSSIQSIHTQTFTSSGTYTPNAYLLYADVTLVARGGDGYGTNNSIGGGGGGGGWAKGIFTAATIGASQTVTLGTTSGSTSSFGTLLTATGGNVGNVTFGGAPGVGSATNAYAYGSGSYGNNQASAYVAGDGGASILGGAGLGGSDINTTYNAATSGAANSGAGGGGNGNGGTNAAAAGGSGVLIIIEYCSQ